MNNLINWLIAIVAVCLLSFSFGRCSKNDNGDKLAAYDKKFQTYQDSIAKAVSFADSMQKQIDIKKHLADSLSTEAKKVEHQNIALKQNIQIMQKNSKLFVDSVLATLPVECIASAQKIDSVHKITEDSLIKENQLTAEHDSLTARQRDLFALSLHDSQQSVDSLQKVIIHIPKPPKASNKILGIIPKPTIPEAFLVGVAFDEAINLWIAIHKK